MGIRDAQIDYMRKRLWLTPFDLQSLDLENHRAWETAGVTLAEVTNVGMGTLVMTDGEFLNGYIRCPYDLDPRWPVGYRVCWTADHDGAGTCTASWILLTGIEKEGQAISLPATALDTVIALLDQYSDADGAASVTDFLLQWTARGIDNDIGLSLENIATGAFLTYKLEMDAAANETSIHFIGMEMDYVPMMTQGVGSEIDRPLLYTGKNS